MRFFVTDPKLFRYDLIMTERTVPLLPFLKFKMRRVLSDGVLVKLPNLG